MKKKEIKKLKTKTSKFIDVLETSIEEAIEAARLNADIDYDKEWGFLINSKDAIVKALEKFDSIQNAAESFNGEPTISFGVNGTMNLFQKSAFTTGDIPHLNADTILSQQIVYQNINYYIPNAFLSARKKRYLLRKEDLVKGIEKLGFDADRDVIVAMNLNIYGIDDFNKIEDNIIRVPSTGLKNVLFILPKTDLPILKHKELEITEQKEHQLGILDDNRKIYGSLIDLTQDSNSRHREKWKNSNIDFATDLKVQLTIAFITEVVWKTNANVVQINVETSLKEQGIVNELSDIEKLVPKKETND
ncbi:hypothetical protein [Leeuwenhoekiella nanhaiensis]|jgi:hypothetical protein|uniref:Uncharacterized protein n=1 Tax=Leeuwenhoekiella nanhaiensis TaxID=1655491 RepID=A0A2G1VTE2_9FLAO|nr:hypothetical protein [Leeuwenhoekiella nanhaiensis]PHQ30036.1 hypothetical protein CJ305_08755 [Leeuwenhoekiella nanhaiensis]